MLKKILLSKTGWLIAYIVFALTAWNFDIKTPMHLMGLVACIGIVHGLGYADDYQGDDANRYKWVSVHLFGLLLAVYTAGLELW